MDKFEIIFETRNEAGFSSRRTRIVKAESIEAAHWALVDRYGTDLLVVDVRQVLES